MDPPPVIEKLNSVYYDCRGGFRVHPPTGITNEPHACIIYYMWRNIFEFEISTSTKPKNRFVNDSINNKIVT